MQQRSMQRSGSRAGSPLLARRQAAAGALAPSPVAVASYGLAYY
jgi:hypothetical protein